MRLQLVLCKNVEPQASLRAVVRGIFRYFAVLMRKLLLLLAIMACFVGVMAQNGTLQGSVKDESTGQPIVGATVVVIGTYAGAYTDDAGNFVVKNLKPGDYSVRISYIGYTEKLYNGVHIVANESTPLTVTLADQISSTETVEIVGEGAVVNLESGKSEVKISEDQIQQMSVNNIQQIAAMQTGVNKTPDGLQIRGGRVYETQYLVDGINAQDPLAGTGFGVDVNAGAAKNVELITGGADAEYGGGTSGVVITRIREGGDKWNFSGGWRRDNLGFAKNQGFSWNTDDINFSAGGPIIRKKLSLFTSASFYASDDYFRFDDGTPAVADQLYSSLLTNAQSKLFAPRQDNRWTHTLKLGWNIAPGHKLTLTNQHSLNINQSTRTLQIIGNDAVMQPGFQYAYMLGLDNANTYTHSSNLTVLNLAGILSDQWSYSASAGRLFTNLRADANGRAFRDSTVDVLYDPASIVTNPISVYNPTDSIVYVYPGPGLYNNGGIATLWHDHWVQEYTLKTKFTWQSKNRVHYMTIGQEHAEQALQWIDVTRPWVGAPIKINDTLTTPSTSIGRSSDVWKVNPATGGFFFSDELRYKGIVASLGLRFNYWAPGKFADNAVTNPDAPVLDAIREDYQKQTIPFLGRRYKARLLPRVRVSFPVTENNVLFFNYSHAMRLPHPRFVYAGLDPVYQDRSFLSNLGNPNINPEVTVSYELGIKSQLTKDLGLTASAFYNDKFDFIVSRSIIVKDQTGRYVEKVFYINQDYARIRGLELSFTRRIGKSLTATLNGTYTIATGKSNSAAESRLQIQQQGFVNATKEQYLAWDRPFDAKLLILFKPDSSWHIGNFPLQGFRVMLSSTYKSGLRYTPYAITDTLENGLPRYELVQDKPYSKIGSPWFWTDLKISRDFFFGPKKRQSVSVSAEMTNITNYKSAAIINGVTGRAYQDGDPLPFGTRDPQNPQPQDRGLPPTNPSRYLAPRQLMLGIQANF